MKLSNGVEVLKISTEKMGRPGAIFPTLIWDDKNVVLVDTGFPGQLEEIKAAVKEAGVSFEKINKIILTHHDIDHVGCLAELVKELKNKVTVIAHEEEKPYIEGDKVPHKLAKLEENLEVLEEDMISRYDMMKKGFEKSKTKVDEVLKDGEVLQICSGMTAIYTPGHTMGHTCFYLKESKILIAGDLLFVKEGKLSKAPEEINFDAKLTEESLKKLINYDINTVVCYHGGVYTDNVNESIRKLLK